MLRCVSALLLALLFSGCSPFIGRAWFPEGNQLTRSTRELRQSSCAALDELPTELQKQPTDPYILEPGDVLLVQPASLDSPVRLPGDQVILPDGTIQLGRFGRILVSGKTIEELEGEVNTKIKGQVVDAGYITVRLVTRDSKVFYVQGEVNAPGVFPLRGRETVLDAIVAAGGLNSNACRREILLSRPTLPNAPRIVLPIDYTAIVQRGDTTTNWQLQPGDRVFVPLRSFWNDLAQCLRGEKTER